MIINPLRPDLIHIMPPKSVNKTSGRQSDGVSGFASILSTTFQDFKELDKTDKASGLALLIGEADDISGLLIDAQKAELSLSLALQIRNKFIDAYNQIMQMSV
jgi:flagellar hook-basal body complex protein FliE